MSIIRNTTKCEPELTIIAETSVFPPSSNPPTVAARTIEKVVESRLPRMANMGRSKAV